MTQFLVVKSDKKCGRGARGLNLYRFLSIFHGRRAVQLISSTDLRQGGARETDVLLIGLPTQLRKDNLAGIKYRRLAFFDYSDVATPAWDEHNREFVQSLSDLYLKPWVEPHWEYGMRLGVLPIRRYGELTWALRVLRSLPGCNDLVGMPRTHDVCFIGNATGYVGDNDRDVTYHQRIEWLSELKTAPQYSLWGGLTVSEAYREVLSRQFGDLSNILYPRHRASFAAYFNHLRHSRVALAPTGNARWSYRHYEALYAGATLVSTDFREIQTLIPLPLEGMVHVPDHAPLLPAIEQALTMRREHPELAVENVQFLERYLHNGDYSRKKPELMERFLAQFE